LGVELALAGGDGLDRGHDLIELGGLEEIPGGTGLERIEHVLLVVVTGQDDDADVRERVLDFLGGRDAVLVRHDDVDQDDVGHVFLDHLEDPRAVGRLADNLDRALGFEHRLDPPAQEVMVVNEENLDYFIISRHVGMIWPVAFNQQVQTL
jgi:hypothetical protein